MQIQSAITGWEAHIRDGRKYLRTATGGLSRRAVFNNELIFQMAAMGIEKLIVGVSQYHHRMPVDHTLTGLVEELRPVCHMDSRLAERIAGIERIDDMCSLSVAHRQAPDDVSVQEILDVGAAVSMFVEAHVPELSQ